MRIKNEEIIAITLGNYHLCLGCRGKIEDGTCFSGLTADLIQNDEILICDQCKEIILKKRIINDNTVIEDKIKIWGVND